jgi:NAD(P)H dehydrogenase (quinone)
MSIESNQDALPSSRPSVLLVTAHPDQKSLTWQITREVATGAASGEAASVRVLDLIADGFNPTFNAADLESYRGSGPTPEIVRYQEMVDAADVTVAIFPVYWWSMPALLKGWVDRVFGGKWAYDFDDDFNLQGLLGDRGLGLKFLAVAANDEESYERHGYLQAIRAQIDHGIVQYCGVAPEQLQIYHNSEDPTGDAQREMLVRAAQLGRDVAVEAGERNAKRLVSSTAHSAEGIASE